MKLVFASNNKTKLRISTATSRYNRNSKLGRHWLLRRNLRNSRYNWEFCFKGELCNRKADCFADDTGLEVEALNGAPGYSLPDMQVNSAVLLTTWIKLQVLSNQSKCPIQNGSSSILMENNTYLPE
jgi:hypothetical protein